MKGNIDVLFPFELFAETDKAYTERQVTWALARKAALAEYKTGWFKARKGQGYDRQAQHEFYETCFEIAGGKTWYNIFDGRNNQMVEELVRKNCAKVIAGRNASIEKKLVKAGVTEVTGSDYSRTFDGFHGVFKVNTDQGPKTVEIETILAGGYNIQCLHQRTLVKVKK